jgi:hypothetical protein
MLAIFTVPQMPEDHSAEERLAELIWRTVKLRVSLLVITTVILLIVWSALINGDKQAQQVDIQFCKQLVAESNMIPFAPMPDDVWCGDAHTARNYVEGGRVASGIILMGSRAVADTDKVASDKLLKQYVAKKTELAEYDTKRRAAYPLQMQLSSEYSGSNIVLNGRFVAEFLPFCVMIVLALVLILGFQQQCYKQQLVSLLEDSDDRNRPLNEARSQFFAGVVPRPKDAHFSAYFVISPERLAIGSLYVFVLVSSCAVVFAYVADIIDLTNSMFLSYPFAVYSAAFVLSCLLLRMRRIYQDQGRPAGFISPDNQSSSQTIRWSERVLVAIAALSIFLPWASGEGSIAPLWGFRLLLKQTIVRQVGTFVQYPLDLGILLEVRIQLILALLFLLVSGLNSTEAFSKHESIAPVLRDVQKWLAFVVLFLSLNFLMYIGILESGAELADNPFLSKFFSLTQGYPMSFYNPAYGLLIFIGCCFGLIWLCLRGRTQSAS